MTEPVRLVIWDLDETFWRGTLTEGPISLLPETRGIVTELAHRGIVSSICSRNDFEQVRTTLQAEGLWDYFIFPSINWEPKGPRIDALIEAVQLRPDTVLFIDDNPTNLEEVRHFNPQVQLAGVDLIPRLLDDPLFAGKSDPELSRLHQYKALERRKSDAAISPGGTEEFLRQSGIRVRILYDFEGQLDRVIELINRTNRLNFTKRRLAEDPPRARAELTELLHSHEIQAGLLHVTDRYGDHGYAGFYLLRNGVELLQFCFSCRILGMGIESWLYRRIGRPQLTISGAVLSNPKADDTDIDWITLEDAAPEADGAGAVTGPTDYRFNWVAARGGCDLQALSHYFKITSPQVLGEFNVGRGGFDARVDHSVFLRYALTGISPEAIAEATKLGYRVTDFKTTLGQPRPGSGVLILSFWTDMAYALYRHRKLSFTLPFALSGRADHTLDARQATPEEMPANLRTGWMAAALQTLRSDYDYLGLIDETLFKENLRLILSGLPRGIPVVLVKANTTLYDREHEVTHTSTNNINLNSWLADVAGQFAAAHIVDIRDVISSEAEVSDWSHFDRIVYYRLYKRICDLVQCGDG